MTIQDLIAASARKLGVVVSGEYPEPEELADGLAALQSMLRSWAALRLNVFASTREDITLVAGTYSYTWGSGGTINTARPNQVLGAVLKDSGGVATPVDIISEGQYNTISIKTTSGRTYWLFFHPLYPLAYIYLYPSPTEAYTLQATSLKPFTETSSFDSLSSTLAFPLFYEEAVIYNLAVRLAPEYGVSVSPEVLGIANSAYDRIIKRNAALQVEPVNIILPVRTSGGYAILSDTYR